MTCNTFDYSPLNLYLVILWILDFKYIYIIIIIIIIIIIDDKIWTWISNFLKQRKQRVVVDGIQSDLVTVDSGVPQGTVLGQIILLLHLNDLPSVISSKVRLI